MLQRSVLYATALLSTVLTSTTALAQTVTPRDRWLTVNCNVGIAGWNGCINNVAVQDMFDWANDIVTNDDGSGADYPCPHWFHLDGNVGTFGAAGGLSGPALRVVDDANEVTAILDHAPGYVKIVEAIHYCNREGSFSGCASNNSMMLAEPTVVGGTAGPSMAHEFGHTVGLQHVSSTAKIMYGSASPTKRRLSIWECNDGGYTMANLSSNGGPSGEQFASNDDDDAPLGDGEPADFTGVPIEQVALHGFEDTVPVEVELYYTQRDVTRLRQMLNDVEYSNNWRTIASLIGLISNGGAEDARALVAFASSPGRLNRDKVGAGIALGYMSARTNSNVALRALVGMSRSADSATVKAAALGLSLSGTTEGLAELQRLRANRQRKGDDLDPYAVSAQNIASFLNAHQKVYERGIRGYYGR